LEKGCKKHAGEQRAISKFNRLDIRLNLAELSLNFVELLDQEERNNSINLHARLPAAAAHVKSQH
jgi:hypothetical protein